MQCINSTKERIMKDCLERIREATGVKPDSVCYPYFKVMKDGYIAYLDSLAFTWGLHLGTSEYTSYVNRFCFPNLTDAIKAFNEVESIHDVPNFGWVAARPEGRMLLPRDLIGFVTNRQDYMNINYEELKPIEQLIEQGFYDKRAFDKWLKAWNINFDRLDVGVKKFYKELP